MCERSWSVSSRLDTGDAPCETHYQAGGNSAIGSNTDREGGMREIHMDDTQQRYHHTQHGRVHWILAGCAFLVGVIALRAGHGGVMLVLLAVAGAMGFFSLCFGSLTVKDAGDYLQLRYGPLPVFRKRIHYVDVKEVAAGRSALIDGLGIHYVPGRGWTYNLQGLDCAVLRLRGNRLLRIGTDDREGLVAYLRRKLERPKRDVN